MTDLEALVKALEAGAYDHAPLSCGEALQIEDLGGSWAEVPVRKDGCPKCGHRGEFVRMALVCPSHGPFAGI